MLSSMGVWIGVRRFRGDDDFLYFIDLASEEPFWID